MGQSEARKSGGLAELIYEGDNVRKDRVIKILEKMGYHVIVNTHYGFIRVILETEKKNVFHLTVFYSELEKEDIVEYVVRQFNKTIISSC